MRDGELKINRDKEPCREKEEEKAGMRSRTERWGRKERKKEGGIEKDRDRNGMYRWREKKEDREKDKGTEK